MKYKFVTLNGGSKKEKFLYHGSKTDLDSDSDLLVPSESKIINNEKAVFAIDKKYWAIFFMARAGDCNIESGFISGKPYILEQWPGAFDKYLKGQSGYIYYVSN